MNERSRTADEQSDPRVDADAAKLERLRDRTDEIELIISGLTTVALFTLPGWLFESLSGVWSHQSVVTAVGSNMALIIVPGLFYVLGFCFALHLMVRAYWAGLIGLRTVFPEGVNWDRTPGLGPIGRNYYQQQLPDLDRAIARADHFASSLFAVISMVALGVVWIGLILSGTMITAGVVGSRSGGTNQAIQVGALTLIGVFVGVPFLLWLLDSLIGRRVERLRNWRIYRGAVRLLYRVNGWIWPQRLILPVQLTLQSNTRPRLFLLILTLGVFAILFIGTYRAQAWTDFSVSNEFRFMDDATVAEGFRSTYYENLRSRRDRVRHFPMIDQFVQERSVLTVFLPYQPLRDDLPASQNCESDQAPVDCLRALWSVRLGDQILQSEKLLPAERFDLNQRGLIGVLPLTGLPPGLHTLEVTWNEGGDLDALDDRYAGVNREFSIPFVFAPAYEIGLDAPEDPVD